MGWDDGDGGGGWEEVVVSLSEDELCLCEGWTHVDYVFLSSIRHQYSSIQDLGCIVVQGIYIITALNHDRTRERTNE